MTLYKTEKFQIEIKNDLNYTLESNDNINHYDHVYTDKSEYRFNSILGINVYENNKIVRSAVIGANSGGTCLHETSIIIEADRILACCSDFIFCLSLPELSLLWKTKADDATCFEIYILQDSYIIHGELQISRLDYNGKILWQQSGADIFTTIHGENSFLITDKYILATDFENRKYKIDFNGQILTFND
jgi:hypothetical protein